MKERCIHAIVSGRVQGVFFRDSTQKEANRLNILGWVRNNPDGRVELMAKGEFGDIEKLIVWLGHGPRAARVDDVLISEKTPDEYHFNAFDVTG